MKRTICIVDDDQDLRDVISSALDYEGLKSISFETPLKFEEYLKNTKHEDWPCLVLIDYFMPEMDGITFINYFREKYKDHQGKIAFALSTAHQLNETNILPDGVVLLQKPYDLDVLIDHARKFATA